MTLAQINPVEIFAYPIVAWFLLVAGFVAMVGPAWLAARKYNLPVGVSSIVGMRLRKVDAKKVIETTGQLAAMEVPSTVREIETFALAGGNLRALVEGMTEARNRKISLQLTDAITLALAGRDIATEVRAFAQRNAGKATRMSVGDVLERSESV
jgi:uncharacterized protein YqfA (UPF0365 family)